MDFRISTSSRDILEHLGKVVEWSEIVSCSWSVADLNIIWSSEKKKRGGGGGGGFHAPLVDSTW
jgi:hypothetical protein